MVGDKLTTDILGGLGAGLTTVWINRTGKASDPEITPDYQIGHLSELLPLVETL
ncbi:putative HAD-hydrolase YfnB [compost metagenome]